MTTPRVPQLAAGAIVIKDQRVLLVQRRQPPYSGLWSIPGGKVRYGETLPQAARREIWEETGVVITLGALAAVVELIEQDSAGQVQHHYLIIDFFADYCEGEPRAADDVSAAAWIALDQLHTVALNDSTRKVLQHIQRGPQEQSLFLSLPAINAN